MDEPEVQTVAITNKRGSGKSLTLAWAGWFYHSKGIPVSVDMKGMEWWSDAYFDDPLKLFSQAGVILSDEFQVTGDNRASMTWDVRNLSYLITQGRKPGAGRWPNITFVSLPWNLQRLRAVDVRLEPFFDWEWCPVYYKSADMLVIYRFKITDEVGPDGHNKHVEYPYYKVPYPLSRGYGNLFDTYERKLPKKLIERLTVTPSVQTQLVTR